MAEDRVGTAAILALAVVSLPYYVVRHPVRTWRLLVHKIGWYE